MALKIVTTLRRSITGTFRVLERSGKPAAWLFLLAPLLLSACAGGGVRNTSHKFRRVIVDAGHGGHDRGTSSSRLILEKAAALDIALKLDQRLKAAGLATVLTRNGDYFVGLNDRAAISNRYRDAIFVSVHLNESRPKPGMHGAETYYYSSTSSELARRILVRVGAVSGSSPHFTKTANFRVLKRNLNPAVLVECGYLSNRAEAARFATPAYRQSIANAIAAAILEQRSQ
jgi:N-acetylmuramoyl-L-alanine amidase